MALLENLRLYKDDLIRLGWTMGLFDFTYNKHDYFVAVIRYQKNEHKPQYALVKLRFIRKTNLQDAYCTWANTVKIEIKDIKKFREFFHIQYAQNIGNILTQFTEYFGSKIPTKVKLNTEERDVLIKLLSISDSEDPDKKYCFALRRNPIVNGKQTQRSAYNDQKARMLKPQLYDILFRDSNETTISFCFSADPADELDDKSILTNFAKKGKKTTY